VRLHDGTGTTLIEGERRDRDDNGRRHSGKSNDRCAQPDSPFPQRARPGSDHSAIRVRARATVCQPPTSKVEADKSNQVLARVEKREMSELGRREEA
jgi:hypothetical protein